MIRTLALLTVSTLLFGITFAIGQDVSDPRIKAAQANFDSSVEKARLGLLADLKKKQDESQKAGDLKGIEMIEDEVKALITNRILPASVSTKIFEGLVRIAQSKLEDTYSTQIKQLTMSGNVTLAKTFQKDLEEFKKTKGFVLTNSADPIEVIPAKIEYEQEVEKAKEGLLADLKKKQNEAQKLGDLKGVEKIELEIKAFSEKNILPKTVLTRVYLSQIQTSSIKLEDAYSVQIKKLTIDGNLAVAKIIQQDLDYLKKINGSTNDDSSNNPLQINSKWVNDKNNTMVLTILERKGESFKGHFAAGNTLKEVNGKINGQSIFWLSKDVRPIKNTNAGGNNFGTLKKDETGYKIDFKFEHPPKGPTGVYTLRQVK